MAIAAVILLASQNQDKHREILRALGAPAGAVICPSEHASNWPDPVEDAPDYLGNSAIKAKAFSVWSKLPALADDSGLEVDALKGAPGVFSARYAGENCSYQDNCEKLLKELEGVPFPERTARFRCVLVICMGEEVLYHCEGVCEGHISTSMLGSDGFGYDPVFVPSDTTLNPQGLSFAQMGADLKDSMSHRGLALAKLSSDAQRASFPIEIPKK